ncbi:hypothetical protein GQ44DRAFT_428646 [Phaeosphaeriaceae sp. PMI808]|nr:hypothetical protein GQ44DRAFT_428646 [Phaeosphaeriaceae sp. PMI808]
MTIPSILKLPFTLRQYKTRAVSQPDQPVQCSLCWRAFGKVEDLSDPKEKPCRPIQIFPCRHIFGDHCLQHSLRSGANTCPLCRTTLEALSDEDSDNLIWVANLAVTKLVVSVATQHITRYTDPTAFNTLSERLYNGTLSLHDSIRLWWIYVHAWLALTTHIGFSLAIRYAAGYYALLGLIVFLANDTSLWPYIRWWYELWKILVTYGGIFKSCAEHMSNILTGCITWTSISTLIFAVFIGGIIREWRRVAAT